MSGFLLDTNALSEVIKKRPEQGFIDRLSSVAADQLATSVICVAELRYGASRVSKGTQIWRRIEQEVLAQVKILPLGQDEAIRTGDLLASLEATGQPIGVEDVLIAATALEAGRTVVTRNVRHFERISGLKVESWWSR